MPLNYLKLAELVADTSNALHRDLEHCTPILHNDWECASLDDRVELEPEFAILGRMSELARQFDEVESALIGLYYDERDYQRALEDMGPSV